MNDSYTTHLAGLAGLTAILQGYVQKDWSIDQGRTHERTVARGIAHSILFPQDRMASKVRATIPRQKIALLAAYMDIAILLQT